MIEPASLRELESRVARALETGDESGLDVLGYGEITLVVGWPSGERAFACKRLPVFPDHGALEAYRSALVDSLARLREVGVDVVETELHHVPLEDGTIAGYCVQPTLPSGALAPAVLRAASPADGHPIFGAIVDAVHRAVSKAMGLDAQLSNWAWVDGKLRYVDVTTPLLLDQDGRLILDLDLFLAAYPWLLRAPIRRLVIPGIVANYASPRHVLRDLVANLEKERLDAWVPAALEAINARVDPPITEPEARSHYASDARTWALLLALRRADRFWQRNVRRRTYPFLLPGPVER